MLNPELGPGIHWSSDGSCTAGMTRREGITTSARLTISRRALLIGAAFLIAFVSLRCCHLNADPVRRFGGLVTRELAAEPPAKSHEARNWALFGHFHLNPADNYQFWRPQSPFWVYPLAGFFKAFGVGYPQLRIFSSLYSALGFATLLGLAYLHLSARTCVLFGLLMLFDGVYVQFSRSGLIEPALSTWSAVVILAVIRARAQPAFILLALCAFAIAFFTKQSAVHLLPALLIGLVLSQMGSAVEARQQRKWLLAAAAFGIVLLGVCILYATSPEYSRALAYNVSTHLFGVEAYSGRVIGTGSSFADRPWDPRRYRQMLASMPLTAPLALCTALGIAIVSGLRRKIELAHVVVALWFLGALAAVLSLAQSGFRYWCLVVPPAALTAAIGVHAAIDWLAARVRIRHVAPALAALVTAGQLAFHATTFNRYIARPRYSLREAARAVEREVGDRPAVIVGIRAPLIVLGTPYVNYYVRSGFNTERAALQELGVTHLLVVNAGDVANAIMRKAFPGLLNDIEPLFDRTFQGSRLKLYDVAERIRTGNATHPTLGMLDRPMPGSSVRP